MLRAKGRSPVFLIKREQRPKINLRQLGPVETHCPHGKHACFFFIFPDFKNRPGNVFTICIFKYKTILQGDPPSIQCWPAAKSTGRPMAKYSGSFDGMRWSLKGPGMPGCTSTSEAARISGTRLRSTQPRFFSWALIHGSWPREMPLNPCTNECCREALLIDQVHGTVKAPILRPGWRHEHFPYMQRPDGCRGCPAPFEARGSGAAGKKSLSSTGGGSTINRHPCKIK